MWDTVTDWYYRIQMHVQRALAMFQYLADCTCLRAVYLSVCLSSHVCVVCSIACLHAFLPVSSLSQPSQRSWVCCTLVGLQVYDYDMLGCRGGSEHGGKCWSV